MVDVQIVQSIEEAGGGVPLVLLMFSAISSLSLLSGVLFASLNTASSLVVVVVVVAQTELEGVGVLIVRFRIRRRVPFSTCC